MVVKTSPPCNSNLRLRDFLKTYSSVPNAFIDDLFEMVGETTSQTDLVIDLEKGAKWLGANKSKLLQTLRRSYVEGVDFTVTSSPVDNNKKYGGNRHNTVLVSPDCFKLMCMRTASSRGELVRMYFLAIEDLLKKYTDQLIDGIKADVNRLERAQKGPSEKLSAGYIYVIRAADSGKDDNLFKVGRSENLMNRLRTYRTGRLNDVDVLFKYRTENLKAVEGCIKATLGGAVYQTGREIYQADLDMIKGIVIRCGGVSSWKQEYMRRKVSTMSGGTFIVIDRLE